MSDCGSAVGGGALGARRKRLRMERPIELPLAKYVLLSPTRPMAAGCPWFPTLGSRDEFEDSRPVTWFKQLCPGSDDLAGVQDLHGVPPSLQNPRGTSFPWGSTHHCYGVKTCVNASIWGMRLSPHCCQRTNVPEPRTRVVNGAKTRVFTGCPPLIARAAGR
jgi:hypothetical protein